MYPYDMTPSELTTADAITHEVMLKIGNEPCTDGGWAHFLNPLEQHAKQLVQPLSHHVNAFGHAAAAHTQKAQREAVSGVQNFGKEVQRNLNVRKDFGGRSPSKPWWQPSRS